MCFIIWFYLVFLILNENIILQFFPLGFRAFYPIGSLLSLVMATLSISILSILVYLMVQYYLSEYSQPTSTISFLTLLIIFIVTATTVLSTLMDLQTIFDWCYRNGVAVAFNSSKIQGVFFFSETFLQLNGSGSVLSNTILHIVE